MNGCDYDCYYCPDQPGMPVMFVRVLTRQRNGIRNVCHIVVLTSYSINGHTPDKLEIIVLGGTWSSFPNIAKGL